MRAIQLDEWGPATNMQLRQVPVPEPTPDQLRIKVHTAGIIFADLMLREQRYVINVPLPHCPGREVAGVVDKVGSAVSDFEVGDRVMATMIGGAYAEYAVVAAGRGLPDGRRVATTFKLPDRASFESSLVYLTGLRTAYLACRVVHTPRPEETVLLHAASGCVGSHLMRLAKKNGNTVIALVSRDEKVPRCRELGADHVINLSKTDYVQEVLRLTERERCRLLLQQRRRVDLEDGSARHRAFWDAGHLRQRRGQGIDRSLRSDREEGSDDQDVLHLPLRRYFRLPGSH